LLLQADADASELVFLARMGMHQDGLLIDGAGFDAADKFFFAKRL
jgi:hypothetical protein